MAKISLGQMFTITTLFVAGGMELQQSAPMHVVYQQRNDVL
jgi:hypothetical protein